MILLDDGELTIFEQDSGLELSVHLDPAHYAALTAQPVTQAAEYERWIRDALAVLQRGVEMMPLEQLGQWSGVREVIESAPVKEDDDDMP